MKHNLQVGQKLWCVRRKRGDEVEVLKVGRKWAEISYGYRISLESLHIDGGEHNSPGKCYLSREEYELEVAISECWSSFRLDVERLYTRPDGVTIESIQIARETLGIPEKERF